jgi:hydrogenase maturation protein HypF
VRPRRPQSDPFVLIDSSNRSGPVICGIPLAVLPSDTMQTARVEGRHIELRGTVQGVGMRPWIYRVARQLGVTGRVWNQSGGVSIDVFGNRDVLEAFVDVLRTDAPPAGRIEGLDTGCIPLPAIVDDAFVILPSSRNADRHVSIPPDLATCADCAAEIADPNNRRYRYAFTNCTNCGPRFTIALDVPYDRPATTMAGFVMCPECQREYDDPLDRRFHAQPNACAVCGPRLTALRPDGAAWGSPDGGLQGAAGLDVVHLAASELLAGRIVAIKGVGGFHLACDATSAAAVARLRARKRRDEKPFAVMVQDLTAAEQLAEVSPDARRLLLAAERPVVLLPRRPGATIADEVAPANPLVGVMLPYTPLHHVLLGDVGRPLVMTSANLSEEPIAYRNSEAIERLRDIADLLVVHDRAIVTRCDDSVAAVIAGGPTLLRRSRGFVPRAITLKTPIPVPVLGCGALLKNTFCLAYGREAWLGPHIGDLENAATYDAFQEAIDRMERFLGFRGELIAHDLHPDYLSTRYAQERSATAFAVQHHHAHIASLAAEHQIDGPVIGVAFDGTGLGPDATAWGGEFLVVSGPTFERAATFRPVPLPGGDTAIRQPWRIALALVDDAFGSHAPVDALRLFGLVEPAAVANVRRMLDAGLCAPVAHGVGRYFDGIGALALARPMARYEGQIAFQLNMAADPRERDVYDFQIDTTTTLPTIDFRPGTRAVVVDLLRGVAPAVVAARFHNTLVQATAAVVRRIARLYQLNGGHVLLSGGCFQNARLAEGVCAALTDFDVRLHRQVPPGDGGIALGQAVIAGSSPCA